MKYRVRYRHEPTGDLARFYPMSRDDALETARQLISDGETEVMIEDEKGDAFTLEGLSG